MKFCLGKPLQDGKYGMVIDYLYDVDSYEIIVKITDASTLISKELVICGNYEWLLRKNNYNIEFCVRQIINNLFNQISELRIDHKWVNYYLISRYIAETLMEIKADKG